MRESGFVRTAALCLGLSILVVLGNLATDLVYGFIDPRIRIR